MTNANSIRSGPTSTYRLQFHGGFTFRDAAAIVPYLRDLGITDCYSSPFLKARPGSTHGYDITDHARLNPEIGSEDDYAAFTDALARAGLGQILDTVPNHMAVVGNENAWWNDVLENGPASPYAGYFDIAWAGPARSEHTRRIVLPVLGEPFHRVLESQQIRLHYEAGAFALHYFEHHFPVAPRTCVAVLAHGLDDLARELGPDAPALAEYQSILTAVKHLPPRTETDPANLAERIREKEVIKRRLATLTAESEPVRDHLARVVEEFNGTPDDPHSFDRLEALLDEQVYRLASWRVAGDEINYRRFFDVNELGALSQERDEVFAATHELIFRLVRDGRVTGLRIDHPDGLFDPKLYLQRLQAAAGPLYVVVEKILGADESLPDDWPVAGTSGYDFLNQVNGLFVDGGNGKAFSRLYREWTDDDTRFADVVYQKKVLILEIALAGELQMLTTQLDRLAQRNRASRDFTRFSLQQALSEVIAAFPVYRSYINGGEVRDADRRHVIRAVRRAMARNPALSTPIFQFIRDVLLQRFHGADPEFAAEQRRFAGKFQQVTAPVMAKGLEDTAFYVYNRLISLNEVGGDPERFGVAPAELHAAFAARQKRWPHSLSATATHDTKRGEDARARINVLSEMPDEWRAALARWHELNEVHLVGVDEAPAPDANEEYFIYQTLLGAWPHTDDEYPAFVERVRAYVRKALHEAKVHTSWINPNAEYDHAVDTFLTRVLDPQTGRAFLDNFRPFQRRVSQFGVFNSLAQTLLKLTAPGVADIYQGTELWDFSFVDPDNRRPVDFGLRRRLLRELDAGADPKELLASAADGRVKLFVVSRGLRCRAEFPGLFTDGEYEPVSADGPRSENVFSFVRTRGSIQALSVIPRLVTRLGSVPSGDVWSETTLTIPGPARTWQNVFTGRSVAGTPRVADVLADFPVALLVNRT